MTAPTAAEALTLAFEIVKSPCSAAEAERAKVLLGIAREIREEQQYRMVSERYRLRAPIHPIDSAFAEQAARATLSAPQPAAVDATAYMPAFAEQTQALPVLWEAGDKADCAHCHTPIIYAEASIQQQTYGNGPTAHIWQHKYTGQAVCVTAPMGGEDETVSHTFAEPSRA